jgi:PPOX class probable F420-dependent enzyme
MSEPIEPSPAAWTSLMDARYVALATFRRDGSEVVTPVWMVADETHIYCYSAAHAGKVKRVRGRPRARLARCDFRGQLLGAWHDAEASVVTDAQLSATIFAKLRKKYGWQMGITNLAARLSGRQAQRTVLQFNAA